MPSDGSHAPDVLRQLAGPVDVFRSALASTLEQLRGVLEKEHSGVVGADAVESARLGSFAAGRIDVGRFAALLAGARTLDAATLVWLERAYAVLAALSSRRGNLFDVRVEPGGSVHDAVASALASCGRAFGAARVFGLARDGAFREAEHAGWLDAFPFAKWTRAERRVAPPLVVHVNGEDLRADGLAEFLDGRVKLVLVARGDAPCAPLVRLVTPRTFVLQTADGTGLDRLAAWPGPGIAAWLPPASARFIHNPAAGAHAWDRLTVDHVPDAPPVRLGGRSAEQQAEDLRQLATLADRPAADVAVGADGDPVDRLAAFLLSQARLEDLEKA